MANYIVLFNLTSDGIEKIKDSPERVQDARQLFKKLGAEVTAFYALLGRYDTMFIISAPDDKTVAKACLAVSSRGNVRTETLRAFTESEYAEMISDLP